MSTSNSYDFGLTGLTAITEALELLDKIAAGEAVSTNDQTTCLRSLNMMLKFWQAEGIGLWKNVEANLFPSYGGYSYSIGPSGDHCSALAYKTEVATAAVVTDLTLTVDSDDNITNGDYIGVELDDGTVQWTTVNGVPAANVVTLTAALTDGAAVDNHVYNYTALLQRPVEIVEARRVNPDGYETPLDIKSRDEYMRLSNKATTGSATQVYYDPILTNGKMYVWPACADVQEYIKFTARIPIEDIDAVANDFDLPQEWLLPIAWNLAVLVAPKYGKALDNIFVLRAEALKEEAKGFDVEHTSIYFTAKRE